MKREWFLESREKTGSCLPEIMVQNRQRRVRCDLRWIRLFSSMALPRCVADSRDGLYALQRLEEVVVTVVSDRKIAELHRQFMGIATPTDVITFHHGEVVVSLETAARECEMHGHSQMEELALYVVHGFLHLNGYTDVLEEERIRMHSAQERVWRECLQQCPIVRI